MESSGYPETYQSWYQRLVYDRTKIVCNSKALIEAGITPKLQIKDAKVLKWEQPPTEKFKINTDVAIGDKSAAGGAIMRDSNEKNDTSNIISLTCFASGHCWGTIVIISIMYFFIFKDSLRSDIKGIEIETDCKSLAWKLQGTYDLKLEAKAAKLQFQEMIVRTRNLMEIIGAIIKHCPKETNSTAHNLAWWEISLQPSIRKWTSSICERLSTER